jgi:hypothetical protein
MSDNECSFGFQNEYIENHIDKFIFYETDYIMDLYYDLRDRLPYFLDKLHFTDLLDFIIDIKFNLSYNYKSYNPGTLDYFESEYSTELIACLYVINNYMKKYKKFTIGYDIFLLFAYEFTSVY